MDKAAITTLDDMFQLNFYIKDIEDFDRGREAFYEYFKDGFPARMTIFTKFWMMIAFA